MENCIKNCNDLIEYIIANLQDGQELIIAVKNIDFNSKVINVGIPYIYDLNTNEYIDLKITDNMRIYYESFIDMLSENAFNFSLYRLNEDNKELLLFNMLCENSDNDYMLISKRPIIRK